MSIRFTSRISSSVFGKAAGGSLELFAVDGELLVADGMVQTEINGGVARLAGGCDTVAVLAITLVVRFSLSLQSDIAAAVTLALVETGIGHPVDTEAPLVDVLAIDGPLVTGFVFEIDADPLVAGGFTFSALVSGTLVSKLCRVAGRCCGGRG